MKKIGVIHSYQQIKLLADSRRLEILRLLMAAPATLTQLARTLKQSPAWIRHHILALQAGDLVEVDQTRRTGRVIEKFYRASAEAYFLQETILPKSKKPSILFAGSHDLALEAAAEHLARHVNLFSLAVGSLDGLVNLRQRLCQISGAHILDENGEYNRATVRHLFPDRAVELVTLAHRTQGLMFARGNPKSIRSLEDLTRTSIRFVNRNSGSGTRLWFDSELQRRKISSKEIRGYDKTVTNHSDAAALIAAGKTDVSLGLQAAAHQHQLEFIPLFEERYDLVVPRENAKQAAPLLDHIQTAAFRRELDSLTGYNTKHSGEQTPL